MLLFRLTCTLVFILSFSIIHAQEKEVRSSSATDVDVKIEKKARVGTTAPPKTLYPKVQKNSKAAAAPKDSKARFVGKNKKAMTVSERQSPVYKTNKRKQKRNNKMRTGGRDE